jgi:hypothetical protein
MARKQRVSGPSAEVIASYVRKNAAMVRRAQKPAHAHAESLREADYKGHHIVVRTRYHIEVDGQVLTGHFAVSNDGQVHYHPVPNISFASAIDLVKQLIDLFPDDFQEAGGGHGHHTGGAHGRARKSAKSKSTRK